MSHAKKASNPNDFILPDLGEGVHEAELIKWRVAVGDRVEEHQILADMETDKALVEVPSPRPGVISALHGKEGEVLHVGNALVSFVAEGSAAVEAKPGSAPTTPAGSGHSNGKHAASPAASEAAEAACDMGSQISANVPDAAASEHREDAGTVVGSVGGSLGGVTAAPGKVLATPAVRRLARDLNVNIDSLSGSGLAGRVTEQDVRAAAAGSGGAARTVAPVRPSVPAPAPTAAPARAASPSPAASLSPAPRAAPSMPAGQSELRIPFRGVRRTIANRLRESVSTAVHFTVMDEADVTELDGLRKKLAAASGEKVSFLPFVAAAVCRCLIGEFAPMNATVDDKAEEIIRQKAVNLGIATDTDSGLMVPVIRDADGLGVLELSRHIAHVAESARARTAPREMLMGSTFTISNVGSHAGRFATPIINYPEVAIIAVGRARDGVVVRNGMLGVGKLLPLSLACDHRVVDGAMAALCLARIVELLQKPQDLLAPARG